MRALVPLRRLLRAGRRHNRPRILLYISREPADALARAPWIFLPCLNACAT